MNGFQQFVYAHAAWQFATFVFGVYLSAQSLRSDDNPDFSVRRHKRVARIFLIAVLAGAVFGRLLEASLPVGTIHAPGQLFLSVLIVALAIGGAIFGIQGERKRLRVKTTMMQAHPWVFILLTALIFGQLLIDLIALHIFKL
jgi:hypothetical protein